MKPVSIAIIDSSLTFAQLVGFLLVAFYPDRYTIMGTAASAAAGLALAQTLRPTVILLDLWPLEAALIAALRAAGATAVICLGAEPSEGYRAAALAAGADAFLLKSELNATLIPTIERLLA